MSRGCVARCTFCQRYVKGYRLYGQNELENQIIHLKEKYNVKLSQLKKKNTEQNLRLVFNEILKNTEKLIIQADKNKKNMKHKYLSREISFILEIAKKLLQLLKKLNILKKKDIKFLILKFKPKIIFFLAGQSSPKKSFFKKKN